MSEVPLYGGAGQEPEPRERSALLDEMRSAVRCTPYPLPLWVTRTPRTENRKPKPETRSPKPETRNPKPETRNAKCETRNPKPETRNPKPET